MNRRGAPDKTLGIVPGPTSFQERMTFCNRLDEKGFEKWAFHPAMLFGSHRKWWGDPGRRDRPHEGLDLCLYRTKQGDVQYLDEKTCVPLIFEGEVAKVCDDFLGQSVFVRHSDCHSDGSQLHTIYGHLKPLSRICQGKRLAEGTIIGTIADTGKSGAAIPPHLHISVAWISNTVSPGELSWRTVGDPEKVVLVDPLPVIKCPYSIVAGI